MAKCPVCAEEIPADAKQCPQCVRYMDDDDGDDADIDLEDGEPAASTETVEGAYELPAGLADIPVEWQGGAVYMLELPARCPHCREQIRTVRVLRLKRTQVTFVSTLPRGGRAVVCPECERILSVELTTL